MRLNLRYFFLLWLAVFTFFSCNRRKEMLVAHIDGWGEDTVIVNYQTFSEERELGRDTVYAKNGSFTYDLPVEEMAELFIWRTADYYYLPDGDYYIPHAKRISLVLSSEDRVKITGSAKQDAVNYTASGTKLMEDMSRIRSQTLTYEIQRDSNEYAHFEAMYAWKDTEPFMKNRAVLNYEMREAERAYIRSNPNEELSAYFLLFQPQDSFPSNYAYLSEDVLEGNFKSVLDSRKSRYEKYLRFLKNKEKEFINNPAPDFTLTDLNGDALTLSEFNTDKYIVIDFWGTWCAHCLSGVPKMKEYYEKYRDQLEIIGVACNDKHDIWAKMVKDKNLPWINLLNDQSSIDNDVAVRYAVDGYPTKILLSPDKTVLEIFGGEGEDFYKSLDSIFAKVK